MAEETVKSSVTGVVVEIVARIGAGLSGNEPIVYLESMKMEIPVPMPRDGQVMRILVAEGDMVNEGQAVAEIA